MPRNAELHLDDIRIAAERIQQYVGHLSFEQFCLDQKTLDAVVRNLEIIGEAAKKLPDVERSKYVSIEWRKIAGLRDILIHEYFGIDNNIVWDVVKNKVPELIVALKK